MRDEVRQALTEGITELDENGVLATVQACLQAGEDPVAIIAACEDGMRLVGERYEQREYYLSGLIMAGEIFREVLEITRPALQAALVGKSGGRVLIGTVQGDIHDIGKTIFQIALRSYGFTVEDLGVDVPPQAFAERAAAWQPDIVGLSGLLSTAYDVMRATVQLLHASAGAQPAPIPIIIGGGLINEQVRRFVGADYWCCDAIEGVRLCQRLMAARRPGETTAGHSHPQS
jgi:methanogenic corrinoid protein MtbC1